MAFTEGAGVVDRALIVIVAGLVQAWRHVGVAAVALRRANRVHTRALVFALDHASAVARAVAYVVLRANLLVVAGCA